MKSPNLPIEDSPSGSGAPVPPGDLNEEIRRFWDADAATYDNSSSHKPHNPAVKAAWVAALDRLLPKPPARILDAGAGTGFLSLMAARLGHRVTALDLSQQMLERLKEVAAAEGLEIEIVVAPAHSPPEGFDAVIERHLLWTLPDPSAALLAWRRSAPSGRLVLFEGVWGGIDPFEAVRSRVRQSLRTIRRQPPDHHGSYSEPLQKSLPLGSGTPPAALVEMVAGAGWREVRLERLRDIEWAERCALPLIERVVGVTPKFSITGD